MGFFFVGSLGCGGGSGFVKVYRNPYYKNLQWEISTIRRYEFRARVDKVAFMYTSSQGIGGIASRYRSCTLLFVYRVIDNNDIGCDVIGNVYIMYIVGFRNTKFRSPCIHDVPESLYIFMFLSFCRSQTHKGITHLRWAIYLISVTQYFRVKYP